MDVAREIGLNSNTMTLLYKETAQRIEFEVIEKLSSLFECFVGGLLEIIPDDSLKVIFGSSKVK